MKKEKPCPVCATQNRPNKLQLRQINLDVAVYLCEDTKCSYPEGHNWITVTRTLDQMYKQNKKLKKKQNLSSLVNKICDEPTSASTEDIIQELNSIEQKPQEEQKPQVEDDFNIESLLQEELYKLEHNTEVSLIECEILNQTALCNEIDLNVSEIIGDLENQDFNKPVCINDLSTVSVDHLKGNNSVEKLIENSCSPDLVRMKRESGDKPIILNQFIIPAKTSECEDVESFDFDILHF